MQTLLSPEIEQVKNPYVMGIIAQLLTSPIVAKKIVFEDENDEYLELFDIQPHVKLFRAEHASKHNSDPSFNDAHLPQFLRKQEPVDFEEISRQFIHPKIAAYLQHDAFDGSIDTSQAGKNITAFAKEFALSTLEEAVLRLYAHLNLTNFLLDCVKKLPSYANIHAQFNVLARLLNCKRKDLVDVVSSSSKLVCSGILTYKPNRIRGVTYSHQIPDFEVSKSFVNSISDEELDLRMLCGVACESITETNLSLNDFDYFSEAPKIVEMLKNSCARKKQGTCILIYGPPGSGKTSLAKILFKHAGIQARTIVSIDEDGDIISEQKRLASFNMLQFASQHGRKIGIVFDECEGLFLKDRAWLLGTDLIPKNMVNGILDNSILPTIFITNSIEGFDSAFLNRMTQIIAMPPMPNVKKAALIERETAEFINENGLVNVSESWIKAVSRKHVSARQIKKAISAASLSETTTDKLEKRALHVLETNQKHASKSLSEWPPLPKHYSSEFVNADVDVNKLIKSLSANRPVKLLFYGVSGSGKTAFGQYLLEASDTPYRIVRASEILSAYHGETEKNISKLFKKADESAQALVIDEVDSIMANRSVLDKQWQISAVNELLTSLELFKGSLIATTNRLDGIDPAIMRRFSARVCISPLLPNQTKTLLLALAKEQKLEINYSAIELMQFAMNHPVVTPGDIAVVAARIDWLEIHCLRGFVEELKREVNIKLDKASINPPSSRSLN